MSFVQSQEFSLVLSGKPAHILVEHIVDRELLIRGETEIVIEIPCDRCLTAVPTDFQLHLRKKSTLMRRKMKRQTKN